MSICSLLIYWKKILGLPRILSFLIWIGGIRSEREFRQIELRGFGGGSSGRQNSGFLLRFCLLQRSGEPGLEAAVDKIKAFRSFFVYFGDRAISSHQRTAFHKKRLFEPLYKGERITTPYALHSILSGGPIQKVRQFVFWHFRQMQSTKTGLLKEKSRQSFIFYRHPCARSRG